MKKILIPVSLLTVLLIFPLLATAAPSVDAPDGWCIGGVPWQVAEGEQLNDPDCGLGHIVVDVDGLQTLHESFDEAIAELAGIGTLWFEPALEAPSGFCQGGVPWPVPSDALLNDPSCDLGHTIVDVEGVQTPYESFNEAVIALSGREGTLWFEPALSAPTDFCLGDIPWPIPAGSLLNDPLCGEGKTIADIEGVQTPYESFGEAVAALDNREGTLWFESKPEMLYLPLIGKPIKVPENWCKGEVAWILQADANPPDPNCGSGTVIVDLEGEQTRHATFTEAVEYLDFRAGTLWFEPALQAPDGFCQGNVPWSIPENAVLADPGCNAGQYAVDIQGTITFQSSFDQAVAP